MPSTTKIPAPIIAPIPIDVASKRFRVLFNSIVIIMKLAALNYPISMLKTAILGVHISLSSLRNLK